MGNPEPTLLMQEGATTISRTQAYGVPKRGASYV